MSGQGKALSDERERVGVAEFDANGTRTGKVHRPRHKVTPGPRRNRSQYRTCCGTWLIRRGKPVTDAPVDDWCRLCYPPGKRADA